MIGTLLEPSLPNCPVACPPYEGFIARGTRIRHMCRVHRVVRLPGDGDSRSRWNHTAALTWSAMGCTRTDMRRTLP